MRPLNLLLQRPARKKYRKLRRWETLYGQIYGPKLVARNFALEPWSLALGGYFTRHGQRSGATRSAAKLLRQFYQELRGLRGSHRWVLQLAEGTTQSHQRPEFLYSHLKQRFPAKNLERERRWIRRLRRRALLGERRRQRLERRQRRDHGGGAPHPRDADRREQPRLWAQPSGGLFNLSSVRQLPRLALLRHRQLQLWWDTPQPLLTASRHLRLWQQRWNGERQPGGLLRALPAGRRRRWARLRRRLVRRRRPLRHRSRPTPVSAAEAAAFAVVVAVSRRRRRWAQLQRRLDQLDPRWRRRLAVRLPALLAYGRSRRRQWWQSWNYPSLIRRQPRWLQRRLAARRRRRQRRRQRRWALRLLRRLRRSRRAATAAARRAEKLARQLKPRRLLSTLLGGLRALERRRRQLRRCPSRLRSGRRGTLLLAWLRRQRRRLLAALLRRGAQRRQREALLRSCHRAAQRAAGLQRVLLRRYGLRRLCARPRRAAHWRRLERAVQRAAAATDRARRWLAAPRGRSRLDLLLLLEALDRLLPPLPAAAPRRQPRKPQRRRRPSRRLSPDHRRHHRHWRLAQRLQRQYPAFNPQQWRKVSDGRWRTLQAQQPYALTFYWENPRSGQLGRWRRSQPAAAAGKRGRPLERPQLRQLLRSRRRLRRRRLAFRPQIHYRIRELHLQDLELLEEQLAEEGEDAVLDAGQRYLLVTRRYGAVGYDTLLRDCFSLLTPQLRLRSQMVGHKSARRAIYQARAGASLAVRLRTLFGWLRELVVKNDHYNLLRRNTARKPNSKRVRDKPERGRRCTQSFYPRLATELRRLLGADEPLLQQLALFDSRSAPLRVPRRHYRWEN